MTALSVLILTHNEEKNIARCIESVLPLTPHVFVVDSGSADRTLEICASYGVGVAHHPWINYASQFNWGLDHFDFPGDWIMRLDADEVLMPGLVEALREFLRDPPADIGGVWIRRRVHFMGRWIRRGGYYPTWLLRVFRKGVGRCEERWMDEHIIVGNDRTIRIHEDIIDDNAKDLTFWIDKHNSYADRELMDLLDGHEHRLASQLTPGPAESQRWLKMNVYGQAPILLRALLYFFYRYFIRLGFLDGREGLIFHFLQGFWYRFLVDAKLYEYRRGRGRIYEKRSEESR